MTRRRYRYRSNDYKSDNHLTIKLPWASETGANVIEVSNPPIRAIFFHILRIRNLIAYACAKNLVRIISVSERTERARFNKCIKKGWWMPSAYGHAGTLYPTSLLNTCGLVLHFVFTYQTRKLQNIFTNILHLFVNCYPSNDALPE